MPVEITHKQARLYLEKYIKNNKARGMVAEFAFDSFVRDARAQPKVHEGAWLLAPKQPDFYRLRHAVFVMPLLFETETELSEFVAGREADNQFQTLAASLTHNALAVVVSGAIATSKPGIYQWRNYLYSSNRLLACKGNAPFEAWAKNNGRAVAGEKWQPDISDRFDKLDQAQVSSLMMRQAFFYGYLKQPPLKKPLDDPYDVDGFVVGANSTVMPLELKEKSVSKDGKFGLDVGRIQMMLRLGLATDTNSLYVIREVDSSNDRRFLGWRYIDLGTLLFAGSWNLKGGGRSMTGGRTQTVMVARTLFHNVTDEFLSDDWFARNASLLGSAQQSAKEYAAALQQFLQPK